VIGPLAPRRRRRRLPAMLPARSPQDFRAEARYARKLTHDRSSSLSDSDRKNLLRIAYNLERGAAYKARRLTEGVHPQHPTKQ
jgi:hypothetical protein